MKTKHTPGPWKVLSDGEIVRWFMASNGVKVRQSVGRASKSTYVAGRYIKNKNFLFNARLMGSAPALLEALREAIEYAPEGSLRRSEWLAVMAQAEGEEE